MFTKFNENHTIKTEAIKRVDQSPAKTFTEAKQPESCNGPTAAHTIT